MIGQKEEEGKDVEGYAAVTSCTEMSVPSDFDIVVGEGENQKTIHSNKAVLACYLPKFEALVGDVTQAKKMELRDVDPEAVEMLLDIVTTRKNVEMPYRYGKKYEAVQKVRKIFFGSDTNVQPSNKKAKTSNGVAQHPALNDDRWLDVTFLVGPNKKEVKANRAVLASMNPLLYRILYGTGIISVDPSKPVEWFEFDEVAVRCVFLGLVQRGMEEVEVPVESVESAKALMDYLMERSNDLCLYYCSLFNRNFEGSFYLFQSESGEGLRLNN